MLLLGFPSFNTVEELAALIHIDERRLATLTEVPERFYRRYRIPKRHRGWREIQSPSKELKAVQAWILRNILDKLSSSHYATAYVKGSKLLDNVSPHMNNRYFLSVDVKDFFPSIRSSLVRELFEKIGWTRFSQEHHINALCRRHHIFDKQQKCIVTNASVCIQNYSRHGFRAQQGKNKVARTANALRDNGTREEFKRSVLWSW